MPATDDAHHITKLLSEYRSGAAQSLDEVFALLYQELRGLAHQQLRRSSVAHHVNTTVLVHEAYEKLVAGEPQHPHDRKHFFAIAARAMRQIVIDMYRSNQSAKRGAGAIAVTTSLDSLVDGADPERLYAVTQALTKLAAEDQQLADLVDLSCFGGLSNEQIAELEGTTVRTVQRRIKRAQAWLAHFMEGNEVGILSPDVSED